jgi:hypothetical protein
MVEGMMYGGWGGMMGRCIYCISFDLILLYACIGIQPLNQIRSEKAPETSSKMLISRLRGVQYGGTQAQGLWPL